MKAQSSRSDGDDDLVAHEAPCGQTYKAGVERVLCLPAQGEHLTGLSALAVREFFTDLGRRRVMLGTFNEDPPRVGVARFGDGSLATFVAACRFTGNQPKIGHNLAGRSKRWRAPSSETVIIAARSWKPLKAMSAWTAGLSLQLESRWIMAPSHRWIRSWAALMAIK